MEHDGHPFVLSFFFFVKSVGRRSHAFLFDILDMRCLFCMFGLPDSGKSLAIYRVTWYNILINEDFREVV